MRAVWLCFALLLRGARPQAIQDSRCYLMNGGAVESFFISEDTPVGSVIGTLSVNGDPSEELGDITLKLQERDAAVGILAGTKNVTLLRALDREERGGPSNVYVNVRCDRRRTTDPSFVIPVSVRVWDVNDNAPLWAGAPYRVRLSELSAVGSRVPVSARAADADQPGPHATIHYSVVPGPHSDYFSFPNELDSTLVIKKPLDYETLPNFTVTLRASDAGTPPLHNDTTLRVEVLDADDQNPKFSHEHYTAVLPEDAKEGTKLVTSPGPIAALDQDVGIKAPLQYSASGDAARLVAVDKDSGQLMATAQLIDELTQPVTIVIKATQVDNLDRYALATLRVSRRHGARGGVRFLRRLYSAAVSEATAPGAVLLTLHTDPPHLAAHSELQFYVSDRGFLQQFAISGAGEVVLRRALDYETRDSYQYQVMVTDGLANDTASINITVLNVNEWEPRFRFPQYEFRLEDDAAPPGAELLPVGTLEVFDGDKLDNVTLTLRGADADMLSVDAAGGVFVRRAALRALNASALHALVTAHDSGAPPRQSSVPVTVHVSPSLVRGAGGAGGGALALFGAALAALALLVCALLLYIYRVRRRSTQPAGNTTKNGGYVTHEKPRSASVTPAPPALAPGSPAHNAHGATGAAGPAEGTLRTVPSSGSLLSVSAGASTILANSNSSLDLRADTLPGHQNNGAPSGRQSQRIPRSKVAPAAPAQASAGDVTGAESSAALMSDHLQQRAESRSGVAWPSATIPARVKKLSWDTPHAHDGRQNTNTLPYRVNYVNVPTTEVHFQDSGETVTDATNPALAEHMNLTVYF